jgi:Na+/proline symporter
MVRPESTEATNIDDDRNWKAFPPQRSLPLKVLALGLWIYTVALGIVLIAASDLVCGSVVVASTIVVVWAIMLTILILGQTREAKTNEERRQREKGW